jgi:hypothetical protein
LGKSIFSTIAYCATFGDNKWIAAGSGGNSLAFSYDGVVWQGVGSAGLSAGAYVVAFGNGRWVAGGQGAKPLVTSTDGIVWSQIPDKVVGQGYGVLFCNSLWVVTGLGSGATSTIGYSLDGLSYVGAGNILFSTGGNWVACSGSKWIIAGIGSANTIAYSNDGKSWSGGGKSNGRRVEI